MTIAAATTNKVQSALAAAVFAIVLVATALRTNIPLWRRPAEAAARGVTQRDTLRQTSQLIMIAYLWCALAFYTIYIGTHVRWQHGWEYGSALMLIALGHLYYLWRIADPDDPLSRPAAIARVVRLAALQAIAIACGLLWLISSGKLSSLKGDWAANQLFLAGGFAIMCLSMIAIKSHAVLAERQQN
jgi:hypothetical protein